MFGLLDIAFSLVACGSGSGLVYVVVHVLCCLARWCIYLCYLAFSHLPVLGS